LYNRKPNWIDFDAGAVLNGGDPGSKIFGDEFFDYVISVASGETRTRNEINGYREIAIFKDGVTL
jgi:altronate hydrolase